jgi:Domain of unknown function (DUF5134)
MASPAWLADLFASVMLLTAGYCASRLILARTEQRPTERDVDFAHVLMGLAMAGMLVPRLTPLGSRSLWDAAWWAGGWAIVFGALAVWFGWRISRFYRSAGRLTPASAHHLPHLVMSGAMVYMLVAVSRPAAGGGTAGAMGMGAGAGSGIRFPLLAIVLAQFMAGYVMWAADRLPALAPVRAWRPGPVLLAAASPEPSPVIQPAGATAPSPAPPWAISSPADPQLADPQPARRPPVPVQRPGHPPLSPRLAACCNIAMGVVMGYMLVIML